MKHFLLFLALFSVSVSMAQTQFWADNFESSPSGGTRTPEENGGTTPAPSAAYFKLTDGSDISQAVAFTNKQGTYYWAGEDHNAAGTGFTLSGAQGAAVNSPLNELQIDWTGINIAGKSNLSFRGLLAANSTSDPWDNTQACNSGVGTTNTDYIIVEYNIDGGAYQPLIRFFNRGSASGVGDKYLFEDTDGNGCGDGTQLTNVFNEFTKTIAGTGTTMNLRIRVFSEGTNEEWGIDNFRLYEIAACTAPVITANPPNRSICVTGNTTFSASATGATAYQWQVNTGSGFTDITNGGVYSGATNTTLNITGATAGMNGYTYRCRAMNGVASCFTNTNSGTLNISNMVSSTAKNDVACYGQSTGSAAVSAPTGAIGAVTYSWSPSGGTASIATGLAANTYTCTITDGIGCQITKTVTINQPASALSTASGGGKTDVSCNGGSNGTATVAPSGGTPGYTYSWAPSGGTAAMASGLAAGTYTVTVTDANNCQATRSYTINQPATALGGTITKTDVSCNGGSNGTATVSITGGTTSYSYSWSPSGGTNATATGLAAGTYTCTITDFNGCQITRTATVNQPATALGGTISKTDVSCNGGSNGTATVSITGGTTSYSYSWSPSGGTNATATGLAAGTYTCTITDFNGCQITRTATVNQPATALGGTITKTDVSCNGGSNGTATVSITGGTTSYSYSWSPSGGTNATATGLAAGTYTCTITDFNGCQITRTATVNQPATALGGTISKTDVSCNGGSNGTATVSITGGTTSYSYSWSPSGGTNATATGLAAGTYTCTITDFNGCQITRTATVNQPSAPVSGTTVVTNVSCNGGNTGAINLTATGGTGLYTYNWGGGITTEDRSGITAGTYTVTITDGNGCTATVSGITVSEPTVLIVSAATQTNVSCNGGSNGAASVNVSGGMPGYTYSWSPSGGTAASATGFGAGTYSITVTDANGCTAAQSFTITEPSPISFTGSAQIDVACFGGNTGAYTVNPATGGTGAFTYDWSPGTPTGDGTTSVSELTAGSYAVVATDANGCPASISFVITEPSVLTANAVTQIDVLCNGSATGLATVGVTGGTGAYTYSWSPSGGNSDTATNLAAGTYTVTVTDANNCQTTQDFTITEPTALVVTASQTDVMCHDGADGSASVAVTGGVPNYTYSWSPTGGNTTTENGLAAGTYVVTITDDNGCMLTQTFNITEPDLISSTTTVSTCESFTWTDGVTYTSSGTHTQTLMSANGCDSVAILALTINTIPTAGISQTSDVILQASGTGTYQWINCSTGAPVAGATAATFVATQNGSYAVVVSNGNCSDTSSCIIVDNVGLDELSSYEVMIVPNPAKDQFSINMNGISAAKVLLYDAQGKLVRSIAQVTSGQSISLEGVERGVYMVNILSEKGMSTQRLIVQ